MQKHIISITTSLPKYLDKFPRQMDSLITKKFDKRRKEEVNTSNKVKAELSKDIYLMLGNDVLVNIILSQ